jgi:predicted ATPase
MVKPVERLTIKGFKSIRSLEDFELGSLNILIGANGAGKSNFVSFFTMLHEMVEQNLRVYVRQNGGADAHLFLGPKVTKEIFGKLRFEENRYEFTLTPTVRNELFLEREVAGFERGSVDKGRVLAQGSAEAKLKECRDAPGLTAPRGIEYYVYQSVSNWVVYHFHDTSETATVRRQVSVRDNEKLRADASNLAAFLLRLREQDLTRYQLIRDTVRLVAPFFDDFKLRPESNGADTVVQLEWSQRGSDYPFHPSQLSDGTLRFICMATALLQPLPPATMLFDEPELGLHPYSLNVMAGLLKQAADRTQVIVSTQSAPLLDHFEPEDIIVVDRKDGASTFRRLEVDELSEWLEEYSLGELWQKNVFEGGPTHE